MDNNIMNWDDVIENDGQEYILLPEGDYSYRVTGFERGQFPGGPKIPPCPKASLTLTVDTEQGTATARVDLLLYRTVEWKMAAFFRSIGQKKHGEKTVMNWGKVLGARGRAHFKPRSYTKDGQERQVNDVAYFIDYDEKLGGFPQGNAHAPRPDSGSRTARVSAQTPFGHDKLEQEGFPVGPQTPFGHGEFRGTQVTPDDLPWGNGGR